MLRGTRTGKLGVTRATGQPHVTPVWFLVDETPDGDELVFTTGGDSVKARALRRERQSPPRSPAGAGGRLPPPTIAVCVDDQQPPYSYVLFEAEARLSDELDQLRHWATRLGGRYMGEDRAREYGLRNAVPGELLVRGRITRVTALGEIAG